MGYIVVLSQSCPTTLNIRVIDIVYTCSPHLRSNNPTKRAAPPPSSPPPISYFPTLFTSSLTSFAMAPTSTLLASTFAFVCSGIATGLSNPLDLSHPATAIPTAMPPK